MAKETGSKPLLSVVWLVLMALGLCGCETTEENIAMSALFDAMTGAPNVTPAEATAMAAASQGFGAAAQHQSNVQAAKAGRSQVNVNVNTSGGGVRRQPQDAPRDNYYTDRHHPSSIVQEKESERVTNDQGGQGVGYVLMKVLLQNSRQRQQEYALLQEEVESRQRWIDSLSEDIQGLKRKWQSDPSPELKAFIEKKYEFYKRELNINQEAIDRKEKQILKQVVDSIRQSVLQIMKRENLREIILWRGQDYEEIRHARDLTGDVLDMVNETL